MIDELYRASTRHATGTNEAALIRKIVGGELI
jgi:hypothetical protein